MDRRFLVLGILIFGITSLMQAQVPAHSNKPYSLLPVLPDSMTFEEYAMLTRTVNWKRLMIAAYVPGYIHYYANHKKTAYKIAAIRTLGMLLSTTGMFRQWHDSKQINLKFITDMETNFYLFLSGIILNAAGYAFDIAHGDYIISRERTKIQFKFRKIQFPGCAYNFGRLLPMVGVAVNF